MVGQVINRIRKQQGITWDSLAEKSGVNKRTLLHWYEGADPAFSKICRVADVLGYDIEEIRQMRDDIWEMSA